MTGAEFTQWLRRYSQAYPSVSRWLNELGPTMRDAQITLWQGLLADIEFGDALLVIDRMTRGVIASVGGFDTDREQTGRVVRDAAKAIAYERRLDLERQREAQVVARPFSTASAFKALDRVNALVKAGRTMAQALDEIFADEPDDDVTNAYRCLTCRDVGVVSVYTARTVDEVRRTGTAGILKTYVTPCCCSKGRTWVVDNEPLPRGKWHSSARYDSRAYCLRGNGSRDEELEAIRRWLKMRLFV